MQGRDATRAAMATLSREELENVCIGLWVAFLVAVPLIDEHEFGIRMIDHFGDPSESEKYSEAVGIFQDKVLLRENDERN